MYYYILPINRPTSSLQFFPKKVFGKKTKMRSADWSFTWPIFSVRFSVKSLLQTFRYEIHAQKYHQLSYLICFVKRFFWKIKLACYSSLIVLYTYLLSVHHMIFSIWGLRSRLVGTVKISKYYTKFQWPEFYFLAYFQVLVCYKYIGR